MCARSVQFVLARESSDAAASLTFAPLSSVVARGVRERHPELAAVDSVVWVERQVGRDATALETAYVRSDAVLRVLAYLGGGWGLIAAAARWVPRGWRDGLYDWVAARRRRLIAPTCLIPSAAQQARFLT